MIHRFSGAKLRPKGWGLAPLKYQQAANLEALYLSSGVQGHLTDIPVTGDYDGDGKTDYAVLRPGDYGYWYISIRGWEH